MAASITANLTDVTLGESGDDGYWSGEDGYQSEIFRQGSSAQGWIVAKNANETASFDAYSKFAALLDMSGTGVHLYIGLRCDIAPFADYVHIGLQSDTAHGSSTSGTRYWTIVDNTGTYPEWYGEWRTFVLDINSSDTFSDSGTLDLAGITDIHINVDNSNSGNIRSIENTYIDTIRFGTGLTITGTGWDWEDVAAIDSNVSYKYDIIRKVGPGVYQVQGQLTIGSEDSGTSTTPSSDNETIYFFDPLTGGEQGGPLGKLADNFYKITMVGWATDVIFNNMSFLAGANTPFLIDFDDSGLYPSGSLTWNGGTVLGAGQGVNFRSGQSITNVSFVDCEQIVPSTSTFEDNTISGYVSDTGSLGGALLWPGGTTVKNCSFIDNDDAIEVTQTSNQTYDGLSFSGNTYDTHLNNGGTSISISLNNGADATSYRSTGGGTVSYVGASVSVTVDTVTVAGADVNSVRVILRASDDTGPFPYQESVTIVNSDPTAGPIATVTHNGHGMATGDYVQIDGASISANNGVHQITVVDSNSYEYSMSTYPGSNPSGTIISTFVALYGLTASGTITTSRVYSSAQPVEGHARKSTSTPFYKTAPLVGSVSSSTGFSATAVMISDE